MTKKLLFFVFIVLCVSVAFGQTSVKLGTISFVTDSIWKVGNQEWSDAVQATGCNKKRYKGAYYKNEEDYDFYADCRSNPDQKGDLFSWCAVSEYKDELCTNAWRVPTKDDFVALDSTLGGIGGVQLDGKLMDSYFALWGGSYGGYCDWDGTLYHQGTKANYWSQSEDGTMGFYLFFGAYDSVFPQGKLSKGFGFRLRCVRYVE